MQSRCALKAQSTVPIKFNACIFLSRRPCRLVAFSGTLADSVAAVHCVSLINSYANENREFCLRLAHLQALLTLTLLCGFFSLLSIISSRGFSKPIYCGREMFVIEPILTFRCIVPPKFLLGVMITSFSTNC